MTEISQAPVILAASTIKKDTILSSQDEILFTNYINRSKSFVLKIQSKDSTIIEQKFPLYFGTDENELLMHRKMALRKKRLVRDPNYNTALSLQNQPKPKKTTKKSKKPSSAISVTSSADKLKNTATSSTTKDSKDSKDSKSVTPPSSSHKSSSPATPVSYADLLRAPPKVPSPSSGATSSSKSTPITNNTSKPSRIPTASLPSNFTDSPQPLGIILLRSMYDNEFIKHLFSVDNDSFKILPHGLLNSGNICYMNSVLQLLFYCQPFSKLLNAIKNLSAKTFEKNSNTPILNALLDLQDSFLITNSSDPKKNTINPETFYASISSLSRFSHLSWGCQEDAEEFLNMLLDGLHEEFIETIKLLPMNDVLDFANAFNSKDLSKKIVDSVDFIKGNKKDAMSILESSDSWSEVGANMKAVGRRSFQVKLSPIVTLFGGQFKSVLKLSNKKSSITLDPFLQVQLDISDKETNDLNSAFAKFSQDEEVSLSSSNYAKKQNFIAKLPSILLIQLKRFSFVSNDESNSEGGEYEFVTSKKNKKGANAASHQQQQQQQFDKTFGQDYRATGDIGRIEKIHKFIKYDHQLTLPLSCISTVDIHQEPNYKLTGVVYHHGRSTENGHYTADVLTSDNDWIRLDDSNIYKIDSNDPITDQNIGTNINKTAYILMYQKV